jgi:hypothetical protein
MDETVLNFIGEEITALFNTPPARQKTPSCPDGFRWQGREYRVLAMLSEWHDFTRRGRMARNMRPEHASRAASHGSLGVGKFFFRVRTDHERIFDLYYDREVKSVDDRLGHWYLYRELADDRQTS